MLSFCSKPIRDKLVNLAFKLDEKRLVNTRGQCKNFAVFKADVLLRYDFGLKFGVPIFQFRNIQKTIHND